MPPLTDWALVGYGKACDTEGGEISLESSPGNTETLSLCLESCEQSLYPCASVTFSAGIFCKHFSTTCDTTKLVANAASFRMAGAVAAAVAQIKRDAVANVQSFREVGEAVTTAKTLHSVTIAMVLVSTLIF